MHITKIGTAPSKRKWLGECRQCKSEAIAEEHELTNIESDQRSGKWAWETCPVCSAEGYGAMCFHPIPE